MDILNLKLVFVLFFMSSSQCQYDHIRITASLIFFSVAFGVLPAIIWTLFYLPSYSRTVQYIATVTGTHTHTRPVSVHPTHTHTRVIDGSRFSHRWVVTFGEHARACNGTRQSQATHTYKKWFSFTWGAHTVVYLNLGIHMCLMPGGVVPSDLAQTLTHAHTHVRGREPRSLPSTTPHAHIQADTRAHFLHIVFFAVRP